MWIIYGIIYIGKRNVKVNVEASYMCSMQSYAFFTNEKCSPPPKKKILKKRIMVRRFHDSHTLWGSGEGSQYKCFGGNGVLYA